MDVISWLWQHLWCLIGEHVTAFDTDVIETTQDIDIIRCSHCGRRYTERVW